ncbi:hypothetical protein LCGC14_0572890 [marine sediment metagenome]|uniref:Uncharacterized protein n=1 Tax=marine sediment metagenome TaxID=412755 RepID=A0A0F9URX1_9ZZZZ
MRIDKPEFVSQCYLEDDLVMQMAEFPNDYTYHKNGGIVFYVWSAIEHFYS